ncbi:PREDICTED: protein lingerer isoform X2 [Nicrophorus vespilloides]|uniref:Protein lingerer isoform X2 n=1 Tax=Nicrophorus vespilloides TaxID=110193 RepID=A0ABM1M2H9_NICVS|nr:PREDICTED: protein lingerer isoform X2 [Nicrophorus vespilloides]
MSSSNRTASRGGSKGSKGQDKTQAQHKMDKSAESGGGGKGSSGDNHKQQPASVWGGGDSTAKANELKIRQIIELTQKSEEQVCLALHECDYDLDSAVNMLFEIEDQDEWETTVKKKKSRQQSSSKADQKADGGTSGGTGDDWNEAQAHSGGGADKDKARNKAGGPQRLHGRHNDSRGWRGREKQENERNLEDGGRDRRGRVGGSTRGGGGGRGRGGGRAGGRYPPRSSRGGAGGTFNNSRPMETWDNSHQWDSNNPSNHTEENWDEFPGADEWCGTLDETKVFTPSQPPETIAEPEPKIGTTPMDNSANLINSLQENMDILAQIQTVQTSPVTLTGALNAAQTQYFSQLTQQNSATDMSKYGGQQQAPPPQQPQQVSAGGYGNQQYQSTNAYGTAAYGGSYGNPEPVPVVQQQQPPVRTKTQRARVPPPSKIPASAVEMPGDLNSSIGYLDLQFGAMDMMSDSSFDGVSESKYSNATPLDGTVSAGQNSNIDLNAQNTTTSSPLDAYSPQKPSAQNSISSALTQNLSSTDTIPTQQTNDYNSTTVTQQQQQQQQQQRATNATSAAAGVPTGSMDMKQESSYSQPSTYNSYPAAAKSTSYQNQTYSSASSNYNSGVQTTSSYVAQQQQAVNSYTNSDASAYNSQSVNAGGSAYQNTYAATNSYQSANASTGPTAGNSSGGAAFPSISQANNYPTSNQAYQQNASQSVYGANTGLNSGTNYSGSSNAPSAQYNSYNSNHKLVKDTSGSYDNNTAATSSVSGTTTSSTAGLALTQTTTSVTKANTTLAKSSVVSNIPPSAAPVMSTQYIMGQMPYFQPPMYSYEEMQMMQQRIPHMTTPFYEMSYQTPTTTLREGNYSLSDGRFTRTDSNASPVPSTQTSTQPMLAGTTGPYFFAPYNPMQPSYQFGAVYTSQIPTGTNAHGSSNSAQYPKPGTYGSSYTSGYDTLSQSQEYNKGGYVGNTQGPAKGAGANASTTGNAANDAMSAMYGKSHTALGKVNSYEKQGFHSGTPPPFTGALGQSALAPSGTGYGPQMYIPTMPHQQHSTQLIHQPLHQDSGNSTGQRTQASNQQKSGAKQGYPNSYWNQS